MEGLVWKFYHDGRMDNNTSFYTFQGLFLFLVCVILPGSAHVESPMR
jgi:hypothetical protein